METKINRCSMVRVTMTLLMILLPFSVWAMKGTGTQNDPFIIEKVGDWNSLAFFMNTPEYSDEFVFAYYKLADNFDNSSEPTAYYVGTKDIPFSGHFDGNGRTLHVNITGYQDMQGTAPFSYINGALIENLNVVGNVNGTGAHAAGLVGLCQGGCVIRNCNVNVNVKGPSYVGGIVGHGGHYELSMEDCVYSGNIYNFSKFAGGLLGWCDNLKLYMSNCLFLGSFSPASGGKYHPVACKNGISTVTCGYVNKLYSNRSYPATATGNNIIPDFPSTPVSKSYVAGEWSKEMKVVGVTCYAATGPLNGAGTSDNPFIISNADNWAKFAADVRNGINTDKYYQLAYNYDNSTKLSQFVGTSEHPFTGNFNGNGKTVSIQISGTETGEALFHNIDNATIENLTVAGDVESMAAHSGGLVGLCGSNGTIVIRNCIVNTKIGGSDYMGGIVGHGGSGTLNIENCVCGADIYCSRMFAGGLVGWCDDLTLNISNSLFNGTIHASGGALYHPIVCKNAGSTVNANVIDTYFINSNTATAQGANIIAGADGIPVSETRVIGEWTSKVWAADGKAYFAEGNGGIVSFVDGTEDVANWNVSPVEAIEGGATVTLTYSGSKKVKSIKAEYQWDGDLGTIRTDYVAQDGDVLKGTLESHVKVSIADGATVTLRDVTINGVNWAICPWAGLTCEGDATIILEGTTTVQGFHQDYPAIFVPKDKTLTIQGNGKLIVKPNHCVAGIGGGTDIDCGNIVIKSGIIEANGVNGAGIGGGYRSVCGDITISGGIVIAKGGRTSAGIGSGAEGTCGKITIGGGSIVEATGGNFSAGIGSGDNGICGDIAIAWETKTLIATKGEDSPCCIGYGKDGSCGNITIAGVTSHPIEGASYYLWRASSAVETQPVPLSGDFTDVIPVEVTSTETDGTYTLSMPTYNVAVSVEYEEENTGIEELNDESSVANNSEGWYTITGVKLDGAPTQKGIYIKDGRTVIVK